MKKLYSFLALAILAFAGAALVTLPKEYADFGAAAGTEINDDAWTQYNASAGGKGYNWTYSTGYIYTDADGTEHDNLRLVQYSPNNAWLISPKFAVKAGAEYTLTFAAKVTLTSNLGTMKAYFSSVSPIEDVTAAAASECSDFALSSLSKTYTDYSITFTATEDGEKYFCLNGQGGQATPSFAPIFLISNARITEKLPEGSETPEEPVEEPEEPGDHECAGIAVPYTSTIVNATSGTYESGAFCEGWQVIDNNGGNAWVANSETLGSKSGKCAYYKYHGSLPGDDYLISPAIHMEKGKEYVVMYGYHTHTSTSNPERWSVYASTSKALEDITAGTKLDFKEGVFAAAAKSNCVFKPEATGDYYITFHCTSDKNKYYVYIYDFSVVENVFAPAAVSGLTATAGADRALSCSLAWTLPTTDCFDVALSEDKTIEAVDIYRDGAHVATLAGDATSFEDDATHGLTSGYHTYEVEVTVSGVKSGKASVSTAYVGPIEPIALPATINCQDINNFDIFTTINGPAYNETAVDAGWHFYTSTSTYYKSCFKHKKSYSKNSDSWLITPPLAVAAAGTYRVKLYAKTNTSSKIEVAIGTEPTIEAMDVLPNLLKFNVSNGEDNVFYDFYAPEAGTYYTAIHVATLNSDYSNAIETDIYSMTIEPTSEILPNPVTELTATADANDGMEFIAAWTNPTATYSGAPLAKEQYQILVYLGSELYTTLAGDAIADGTQSLTIPVDATGVYTVTVKTAAADNAETMAPLTQPSATTTWVGPKTVALPYTINFGTNDPSEGIWEKIDGNADKKTWAYTSNAYATNGSTKVTEGSASGLYEREDYFISPAFALDADDTVEMSFQAKGGVSALKKFPYNIYLIKSKSFDAATIKTDAVSATAYNMYYSSYTAERFQATVSEAGEYQIVIAANEYTADGFYTSQELFVKEPKIRTIVPLPGLAEELTITPGEDYALTATISWINPTMDSFGGELADDAITKAEIYRGKGSSSNMALVGTVEEGLTPGAISTFVDETIPEGYTYYYYVKVYTANGCSETAPTAVQSPWIGSGRTIPQTGGIEYGFSEDFSLWTCTSNGGSGKTFSGTSNGLDITSTSSAADAWAVAGQPLQFEKNNIYKIKAETRYISYSGNDGYECKFDFHIGNDADVKNYTKIGSVDVPLSANGNNTCDVKEFLVHAVDPTELVATLADDDASEEPSLAAVKIAAGPNKVAVHTTSKTSARVRYLTVSYVKSTTGLDDDLISKGFLYADGQLLFEGEASVAVYDLSGALLGHNAKAQGSFDLSGYQGGMYIIRVDQADGQSHTLKLAR